MRFSGERVLTAPVEQMWAALHDAEVLRAVIPGCAELAPLGSSRYAAALAVRVGLVADTYRGAFFIEDVRPGSALRLNVDGRGRCGRLKLDLQVQLVPCRVVATVLRYDARATVTGAVAHLGHPALSLAGGHITGRFFRDLDRWTRQHARPVPLSTLT